MPGQVVASREGRRGGSSPRRSTPALPDVQQHMTLWRQTQYNQLTTAWLFFGSDALNASTKLNRPGRQSWAFLFVEPAAIVHQNPPRL